MSIISKRAAGISPSPTLAITAKAKQMKAEGIDVVSFGAGEPDFDTPQYIKDAAVESINKGFTKYTAASGTPDLKKAVCAKLLRDNGLEYKPENIIVSVGAKHSIYNAILATVDPGDEVIIPTPYWVSYPEIVKMAGGVPVFAATKESEGFVLTAETLESLITSRTKMLILNSPSNPTGGIYSRESLEAIANVAVKHGILVLSDEIYEKIIYDGAEHVSIASFGEDIKALTITVNGMSKAYSMTGWRLGYAAAVPEIVKAMSSIQGHSTSNPTSFTQPAAAVALNGGCEAVDAMVKAFDERRKYIVGRLNDIPGVSCFMPGGAFYAFANISGLYGKFGKGKLIKACDDFASYLLDEVKVAVVPGSGFGAPAYMRLSYATSMEAIKEGLDRIAAAVAELK